MKFNITPISDTLSKEFVYVDNELQEAIKQVKLFSILSTIGVSKRSGDKIPQLIFAIRVQSINLLSTKKSINIEIMTKSRIAPHNWIHTPRMNAW